jgi:uncharacterized protein (TIGR03437 family)
VSLGSGGVLFGTTAGGGAYGLGTVFSLTPPATPGGPWTHTVLYNFAGNQDGIAPGGVVVGGGAVLYGTTGTGGGGDCLNGGVPGCGTFYSLSPPAAPGGAWTEAVLLSFSGAGAYPGGSLVMDGSGVFYGTTTGTQCPPFQPFSTCETTAPSVFSLVPPATLGGAWTATLLYSFPVTSGGHSNVVIGSGGLPYASAYTTGNEPTGQVFSLARPALPAATVLYGFTGLLGAPNSLAVGGGGVLYGTSAGVTSSSETTYGGVWSLTPPATPGGAWTEATLYEFTGGNDGSSPHSLTVGSDGTVYGVTEYGPVCSTGACGSVFALTPPATPGGTWVETTLHSFTGGTDGGGPNPGLTIGDNGVIYGTTVGGGTAGLGTVFTLTLAVPEPVINPGGLVTAASYTAPVAPGSIASVFGDFFVPAPLSATQSPLPASLAGLSLQFGVGTPAPLFFVSGGQINLQVPWELAGQPQANLAATLNGQAGAAQTVNLAAFAPAIFATNAQGSGQGAILDESNHLVDASNPAMPGSTVLQIFCTGLGPVTIQPQTGSPAPLNSLSYTSTTPTVTIGGVPAGVSFSGLAPGFVGLYQVNAQVPPGLAANGAVPVVISMPGATSNTVTIAAQ